jgi:hypothetical protein
MKEKNLREPSLETLEKAGGQHARNRLLLEWLSDDNYRARLYKLINEHGGSLEFPSRDTGQREAEGLGLEAARPPPVTGHKTVYLVTDRAAIEKALRDDGTTYSNRVYAELGGGNFMLALDAAEAHKTQRDAYGKCFSQDPGLIMQLSRAACEAASVMSLRAADFDLAAFAEQSAVRFCQKLMGYSFRDYTLLEATIRVAYRGLVYQVLGRHFVSDPLAIPAAKQALGRLLARTNALIDAYTDKDEDALKGCVDAATPNGLKPVLNELGKYEADLNGEERAVIAVGAVAGTVGNVQAAVCIAMKALFADPALFSRARGLLRQNFGGDAARELDAWQDLIKPLLAINPPIPFLPRLLIGPDGKVQKELILALGGGTTDAKDPSQDDPLIWGLPPPEEGKDEGKEERKKQGRHWCEGKVLAWPLIVEIVRHVIRLPGLDQRLDPQDASVIGLKKRWGFACESYPLTHQRERRVVQSSLNVAMRLKSPVKENADRVREVIRSGAPRIEAALREARHVHFAWFELIENNTVLVLHTVFDGPVWAYIQHFALKVGDLFDAMFECIENPPPMPVEKFPSEFVAHIQRYDRAPAMGYFFSAYPRSDVARILRSQMEQP